MEKDKVDENEHFIKIANIFIKQANEQCDLNDNQLVNSSLLYASARFSAFVAASMSESKESYQKSTDDAIKFYTDEFHKMLKAHIKQYTYIFDDK